MATGGIRMIELRSAHLTVRVDADRGAQITHIGRGPDENVLFHADWQTPLRASRSATYGDPVLDWLSEYRGDWQELFPNAGDACEVMGVPLPFHGEVSTARWDIVEHGATRVVLRTPARLPLILERTMYLDADRPALRIEERAVNESDVVVPCIWGHHPVFAVSDATVIDIPATEIHVDAGMDTPSVDLLPGGSGTWPFAPGRDGTLIDLRAPVLPRRVQRLGYLPGITEGWAAVRDPISGIGAGLAWDASTFRHAWLWQDTGTPGMPWYGRSRLTAIEPHVAWPSDGLASAVSRGQALAIAPGGQHATWITCVVFDATDRPVRAITRDGMVTEDRAR
jgi:hypothetical protein